MTKQLKDSEGCTISVTDVDGFHVVDFKIPNHADVIRSIKHWKARDDDVLIWAYPKTGTHWLWDMTYQLYTKKVESANFHKSVYMLEALTEDKFDSLPSPRVLNSHIYFEFLPEDFIRRKCKIIYIIRNPKDTAVSFYNHHKKFTNLYGYYGKWINYIPMFLQGKVDSCSWFDHVRNYERFMKKYPDYPIHTMHYEDLKEKDMEEFQRMVRFLEVDADEKLLKEITEKNSFQNMRSDKEKLVESKYIDSGWLNIYRKGEVGDWKNWFTVAQNEEFDAECDRQMQDISLKVRYTLE